MQESGRMTPQMDRSDFEEWDSDEAGVRWPAFGEAVSIWAWCQQRPISVAEAALAFNVAPSLIALAIEEHAWMYTVGDPNDPTKSFIGHDGE